VSSFASACDIADAVRGGRITAVSVAEDALDRIHRRDGRVNAFTAVLADRALAQAHGVDATVQAGRDPGPLAGVPFAVKNLFDIEGLTTLAGSIIEAGKPPAAEDAPLVARFKAAGAVLLGALNMDEYAYGFTTENSHYGPTRNPHDLDRVSGGSSGGSAAAVAAGFTALSLGSDTNGSIRVPASFCGVYGLKPTYGRLTRRGTYPFVHSLDHVGPFARTVADLALAYDVCQGADPLESNCADRPVALATPELGKSVTDLRVGVLGGWFETGASAESLLAVDLAGEALRAVRDVILKDAEAARAGAFCLTGFEGGRLHLDDLRKRPSDFDPATRDRLIAGVMQAPESMAMVRRLRAAYLAQARALFARFDVLIAPATPFSATRLDEPMIEFGGRQVLVRANAGLYAQPISFIGLPVIAAPVKTGARLPIGVQMIAAPWAEQTLFRAAAFLEREGVIGVTDPVVEPELIH
jgi:AtzE family amidohydrolase